MSDTNANQSLFPYIVVDSCADALPFYAAAFGAQELFRLPGPDGASVMHAEMMIGDNRVMMTDANEAWGCTSPKQLGGTPFSLHLNVADVDAAFERAVDAGCSVDMPVADMFWGDRFGKLSDPFGHSWSISTKVKEMTPEEITEAMKAEFGGEG